MTERIVDIQSVEAASARSELDLYLTYYIPVAGDPESVFYPLLDYDLSGETNLLYFNDEAMQAFLDRIHTEGMPDAGENIAYGLISSIMAEPPLVFLFQPYLTSIIKDDILGAEWDPAGFLDLRRAFIETGK